MPQTAAGICLALVLAVNVGVILPRAHCQDANAPPETPGAKELQYIRDSCRAKAHTTNWRFALVGCLVTYWTDILPLAENQKDLLEKLNTLLNEARVRSWLADADWPTDDLNLYLDHRKRSDERRVAANRHAERIAALGLLTEPQAVFVLQHSLLDRQERALYDANVQELLEITEKQKQTLENISITEINSESKLNVMSVDKREQEDNALKLAAIVEKYRLSAMAVLTPQQRLKWSKLTAERRLPAEPPDLPVVSDTAKAAARGTLAKLSPTFRALASEAAALNLSDKQWKLLQDLEDITAVGLVWIDDQGKGTSDLRPAAGEKTDRASQRRAELVERAERFALDGILDQEQAEILAAHMAKGR
jgi:hypothetical protein